MHAVAATAPAGSSSESGSVLLSTSAPRWKSRSTSSAQKRSASCSGAASSVVTTANVVRRSCMSRSTALRPLDEPVVHRLEVQEELGDVFEELAAEDAIGHLVEGRLATLSTRDPALAADAVRQREPPQQPAAEEVGHARRRFEEIDGVSRRRRVDHDEVVLARSSGSRTGAPSRCSRGSARSAR